VRNAKPKELLALAVVALLLFVVKRSRQKAPTAPPPVDDVLEPNFDPMTPDHIDGFGDVTWIGDTGYFQGGYVDLDGNVTYTGAAGELPWYLSWGAGWLF
jgi:hypothetical protein